MTSDKWPQHRQVNILVFLNNYFLNPLDVYWPHTLRGWGVSYMRDIIFFVFAAFTSEGSFHTVSTEEMCFSQKKENGRESQRPKA